uniref:Uncharacterized protein n=1 Tax=Sparus aurata TaxID=8175 RepID=A0A671TQ55_SPAAU
TGHLETHVKRRYHSDYIQLGFFWTGDEEDPKPHCVLCYETLANEAMKPAKLTRHLETKHKEYMGKPTGFFERKRDELTQHMMKDASQFFAPGENAKTTKGSYKVSLLIAKAGKPHSIGEILVKPAAKVMANILFGGKASDEINRIPLSNDTVQRRIKSMAESVEDQLVTRLGQSQFFALQLDESTDIGNEANLLCFVRYIYAGGVHDDFLFCRSLPTNTTGEAVFQSLNDFIMANNMDWSRCVGICTDGATAMTGKLKGLVARVRAVVPSAAATHCCIHREQLAVKKIATVTEHTDELYDRMHDFPRLAKLAYLADVFSALNTLNVALQGKTVTIFNVQDKIKATRMKMELWCGRLDRGEFDKDVGRSTVASFKQHLQDLHSQLGIYFPELDTSFEWIRNPFGDKTHIEQVSSKLSPREVDSLVDIASDGTLRTTFREKGLTDFWLHIQPEHPELADSALKLLMPFPTTYNCEVGFSSLVGLKTKQRNRINVDYDMRLKLSSLEPDIASLMAQKKKQYHSSHSDDKKTE